MYRIGIDIGGTKTNIGIFSGNTLVANKKVLNAGVNDLPASIKETLDELCAAINIGAHELVSCGVGIPGTVSEDGKRILKAPNISLLTEDFVERLESLLHLPVKMIQDSRAAAWGEYKCGLSGEANTLICIALGTGIGTGLVVDGKIYNGALGSAGELGHTPIKNGTRPCGCGKIGCLEKYAAGRGLDITASELLGEGKSAKDLFSAAKDGDERAIKAIDDAVGMLGSVLVGAVNLMSPDCLVFSGGLGEEEYYVSRLTDYINEHAYSAGRKTLVTKSKLGENAPLYGAALAYGDVKRSPKLSASIMCADLLNMGKALGEIKDAGIEYLHCDIMDNHFVPNLMLPMEMLNKLREGTDLPYDVHIMAENPESIIEKLVLREGDIVSVHYESTVHLEKALAAVREKGAIPSVAINPATPVEAISEVLDKVGMVLVMTVNPGFAGQKLVGGSFEKIARMRKYLDDNGHADVMIQVDGNCSFENVPKMYDAGAEIFVVGTSSVFKKDMTIKEGTDKLMSLIK